MAPSALDVRTMGISPTSLMRARISLCFTGISSGLGFRLRNAIVAGGTRAAQGSPAEGVFLLGEIF
jgi:hypothetical protein